MNPKTRKRIRWLVIGSVAVLLLGLGIAYRIRAGRQIAPWQVLKAVIQIESQGIPAGEVQPLGWYLAMLGRDHEVREMDFHPSFDLPPLDVRSEDLVLSVVPWKEGLKRIAAEHRIVMMMENHFVSKHREFIGATLPLFREAGFTHYAAEGIGESASSLKRRGYPDSGTGFYTADPQFGNVIRRALELEFHVLGYDFRPFGHEWRETYAASRLAKLFDGNERTKLLVHAGLAHVFKEPTDTGQRWLASWLWKESGIEPFTIWQWSAMRDNHEYRVVAKAVEQMGRFDEPVLLMPPPKNDSGLRNIPPVDAILVHPQDLSLAPAHRTPLLPQGMKRIDGKWLGKKWPVIIAAMKDDEPPTAVPLDQVMMREGETNFVLWVPHSYPHHIVVFDDKGLVRSKQETKGGVIELMIDP